MAIAFVQYDDTITTSTGTSVATDAMNTTTGNLIVACVSISYFYQAGTQVDSVTDTAENTYVQAVSRWRDDGNTELSDIWYCANATGNANNVITANFSKTCSTRAISASEFSGVATAAALIDTSSNSQSSTTSHSSGNATSDDTGQLIIGNYRSDGSSNLTVGSGFTIISSDITAVYQGSEYLILGAAGDYDSDFSTAENEYSVMTCAIFKAAAGAPAAKEKLQINITDSWKEASAAQVQINIADDWKTCTGMQIQVADAWKVIF